MTKYLKHWAPISWLLVIGGFALLHALHLGADFPNHTLWTSDWAKYTDEGWYGNAAVRAHLFGHWYLPGDFNPAVALPVLPFLEWVLFFFTGVSLEAVRGLTAGFFFLNLLLAYLLLRQRAPRWAALGALTLMATSPFLFCFSRLGILEPPLTAATLAALNLAVRLPRMRRPILASVALGLLLTVMVLTKTTAVFLLPAVAWAALVPLRGRAMLALRSAGATAASFALTLGAWMALVAHCGLMPDYRYLFFVNHYVKPPEFYWPLLSLWWCFHGGFWIDRILYSLACAAVLGVLLLGTRAARWLRLPQAGWAQGLAGDPVWGASVLAAAGYIFFMTIQNHPQPRYFAFVAVFCFLLVAQTAAALVGEAGRWPRGAGWAVIALASMATAFNAAQTANYALHPEYTFLDAARRLTAYIDAHPNGNRLLLSISGDQIALATHLPAICDDFGTQELVSKLGRYQPGWFATWNDLDPGTLEDLHNRYSLEQVAVFPALDDPERNQLTLFKLHPLPGGRMREPSRQNLQVVLPDDRIEIPIE
ncbi:MAG: glycosyltransferase family 39 protein [Terracidiphilus sp.]